IYLALSTILTWGVPLSVWVYYGDAHARLLVREDAVSAVTFVLAVYNDPYPDSMLCPSPAGFTVMIQLVTGSYQFDTPPQWMANPFYPFSFDLLQLNVFDVNGPQAFLAGDYVSALPPFDVSGMVFDFDVSNVSISKEWGVLPSYDVAFSFSIGGVDGDDRIQWIVPITPNASDSKNIIKIKSTPEKAQYM
ncbi:hypothetical protein, partial [Pseudomonas syringae]|uniref:hypothetical protein n=1 Tax=Pseudomonas syringae TaxID=317 RepID=UPI001F3F8B9E